MSGFSVLFENVEIKLLFIASEKAIWQMCRESGSVFINVFC